MMEHDAEIKPSTETSNIAAPSVGTSSRDNSNNEVESTPSRASHKCVFCSQMFETKLALQDHFRRHANGEIDIKGMLKVKQNKASCKAEDRRKIPGQSQPRARFETAVCDICNEVFSSTSSAITHKFRKHPESVEKHYCSHCGMMFPIKANRDKHVRSHGTVIKPNQVFPCLPCKVAFYNERARSFHIESAHKGAIRLVNPIQTPAPSLKIVVNNAGEAHSIYYCHLCGCEYQVKYNLQKHLVSRHTEEERNATPQAVVQCSMCSALFYSERAYAAHSLHHRQSDLYATSETMRQQVVQRIDQDFDLRRVPTPLEKIVSASAVWQNRSETWKSIRAAKKREMEREENSVTEYFESNLRTENRSKKIKNDSNKQEKMNKNIDIKDANENIFSESSDNDGTKNDAVSLNKILKSKDAFSDCIKKDICVEETNNFEPNLIKNVDMNSGTDTGAELFNKSESDGNMKRELSENIIHVSKVHVDSKASDTKAQASDTCDDPFAFEKKTQISEKGLETCGDPFTSESKAQVSMKGQLSETAQQEKPMIISPNKSSDDSETEELEVEKIIAMRKDVEGGREYLVRWQGFEPADDTWEKEKYLNCPLLVKQFLTESNKGLEF